MTTTVTLDTPLSEVLGAKAAKALADHLDLGTAGDLLRHYPRRYDERGAPTDMAGLTVGEQATLLAQVRKATVRPMRARRSRPLRLRFSLLSMLARLVSRPTSIENDLPRRIEAGGVALRVLQRTSFPRAACKRPGRGLDSPYTRRATRQSQNALEQEPCRASTKSS